MSSEEPIRSVPDELFRKVSAKAERHLPDALFGGPPPPRRESGVQPEGAPSGAVGESGAAEQSSAEDSDGADAEGDAPVAEAVGLVPAETGSPVAAVAAADDEGTHDDELAAGVLATDADAATIAGLAADTDAATDVVRAPDTELGADAELSVDSEVAAADFAADAELSADTEAAADFAAGAEVAADAGLAADAELSADPEIAADADSAAGVAPAAKSPSVAEPAVDVVIQEVESVVSAESVASTPESADAEEPAEPRNSPRPVLLVIADSLAYFGPKGGLPADDPRIWPNLVAAELDWDVELVGRIGWTCRDAYWALIGDPRVWAAVPRAGAVVFAVGGMDTLPSPLPTALRELIRYVRPPAIRRAVRATYTWLQPKLSKLGRPVALPPKVSVDYLEQSRTALAQLRPDLPVVAVLPSVHQCDAYGRVHSGREPAVKALRAWSGRTSVPLVDLAEAVRDNIFSGEANPDGIHWGWAGHTAVANAMVKTLQEVR